MRGFIFIALVCLLVASGSVVARVSDDTLTALLRNSRSPIALCAMDLLKHRLEADKSFLKPHRRFLVRFQPEKFYDTLFRDIYIQHIIIVQNATALPQEYIEAELERFTQGLHIPTQLSRAEQLAFVQDMLSSHVPLWDYSQYHSQNFPKHPPRAYHQAKEVALLGFALDGEVFGYTVFHDDWQDFSVPCSTTDLYQDIGYYLSQDDSLYQGHDVITDHDFIFFAHLQGEPSTRLMLVQGDVMIDTQTSQRYRYQPEDYADIVDSIMWQEGAGPTFVIPFEEIP